MLPDNVLKSTSQFLHVISESFRGHSFVLAAFATVNYAEKCHLFCDKLHAITKYVILLYFKWNAIASCRWLLAKCCRFEIYECQRLYIVQKAAIHQVTTMLATCKNALFPDHNQLVTTGTDDPTL